MPVTILQFFSTLNNGGAENRMMDIYRCLDTKYVLFDFAVLHEGEHFFDSEVYNKGSQKYVFSDPRKGLLKNYLALVKFFKAHQEIQAVHAHAAWYNGIVLMAAKHGGIKIRISHARDSVFPDRGLKDKVFANIGKLLINRYATRKIAISKEAAENIYGKKIVKKGDYLFVPNAIDQKKYKILNNDEINETRKRIGITTDKKAFVTVANLRKQKNHTFLLDIVYAMKQKNDNFVLYLIGEGNLRTEIENKIRELKIEENVKLLGSRNDVPDILGAFDGMIFPSLFEGLGGVVLEAQLVGVPSIVSDVIPRVVDVGIDMVEFVPLSYSPEEWADIIFSKTENYHWDYTNTLNSFKDKGYIIEETAKRYLKEYGIDKDTINKAMK